MGLIERFVVETLGLLLTASPFVLLGLLAGGFIHVLMPASLILRWMGRRGLSGSAIAALLGIPLPVCSCGVVPIATELRRKGASRPATLSFLITTPESSLDSILLTWGLMGPIMAVARPIAAFCTAMLAGAAEISSRDEQTEAPAEPACCDTPPDLNGGAEARLVQLGTWWRARRAWFGARLRRGRPEQVQSEAPADSGTASGDGLWAILLRPALRYSFVDLLDLLVFWLILGLLAAGVVAALVPSDLAQRGLGSGLLPMLLLLVAGVPLYLCASGSTPVAAALLAKGISPGAALVFLLAGPATNLSGLLMLAKVFGRRMVLLYLSCVVIGALGCGLLLDAVIGWTGWQVSALLDAGVAPSQRWFEWLCAVVLLALAGWRLSRGALASGMNELRNGIRAVGEAVAGLFPGVRLGRRRLLAAAAVAAALVYLANGLYVVPVDSVGFGFVFGRLTEQAPPGLHWLPPFPFGRVEVQPVADARKADVGFASDPDLLRRRRVLVLAADPQNWHSSVAAMNVDPEQVSYLSGDENLVDMAVTVHYALERAVDFLYRADRGHAMVALYAQTAARQVVAERKLDDLLTDERRALQEEIAGRLSRFLDEVGLGVRILAVRVVDVHPPQDAVYAFRDVSSAREDRETVIFKARETLASRVPRARGEAAVASARSAAEAHRATTLARARAGAFRSTAAAYQVAPRLLGHLLRLESAERFLARKDKLIVPAGSDTPAVAVWQQLPPANLVAEEE